MATNQRMDPQPGTGRDDLSDLISELETSRSSSSREVHDEFLQKKLRQSVRGGSVPKVIHLLEVEQVSTQHLRHSTVAAGSSVDLLKTLTRFGYDPDEPVLQGTVERGHRLIDYQGILENDAVVRWLVGRGVSLDHGQHEYVIVPNPPPLLDTAAQWSSVPTFKFLRDKGAMLGRRTLHLAVLFAAAFKADPSIPPTAEWVGFDPSKKWGSGRKRMSEMLPYLVDELRLDVNAMDIDREPEYVPTGHWGTPLCYAVYFSGDAVAKWLLSKGADPRIGDEYQRADATRSAEALRADKCLALFEEWEKSRTGNRSTASSCGPAST